MTKEKIQQKINARNALSPEQHARDLQDFVFDLQLFGGGGDKDAGKIFGSILFGALTAGFGAALGLATHGVMATLSNFMLGASLFSGIWTATHQPDNNLDSSNLKVNRFDKAQETASSEAVIPVVYGERLVTGNQTWHETSADAQTLHKHVVLCEGGINAIKSVTANDLILPTGEQQSNTVFTLQNTKYEDAVAYKKGKTFYVKANGKAHSIYLANKADTSGNFWSYQMNVSALVTYINSLHNEGWQAFPYAATNAYPGDLLEFGESYQYVSSYTYQKTNRINKNTGEYEYDRVPVYSTALREINCYLKPVDVRASTVAGGTKYVFHDCEMPSNYATVGGYPKMAWLDLTFTTQSDFSGNPTVSCVIQGRKIYDTRTGKTAYSTNPAMCLRDFLLSQRYGMGKWFTADMLDDESWKEAADYCDEEITFRDGSGALIKAKRYELNMVIDQKRSGLEWVQEMLACFAGFLVYSDAKLKLRIEKPTDVSYKFNDGNCSDLKISPLKLSETPNKYEVTIIDPLNNWSSVKALCEDYADQKLRQRIVTKEVSLEGVTSQNQALRLARFYRDYNLVCPIQVSFSTGMQAMHLEPGDVVTIDYHGVFKDMPIRIAEIKETNKGTFEISGRQYNDTIYGDELGGGIHWYNYSQMVSPLNDRVPEVLNLTVDEDSYIGSDGSYYGKVTAKWDSPNYQFLAGFDVYYRLASNDEWTFVINTPENTASINNVPKNTTVEVKVVVVNTYDRRSEGTTASIYTTGKNSPPAPITKFVVGQYGNEMRFIFSGVMPSDPDVVGAEIRRDGKNWDDAVPVCIVSMFPYTLENQDFDDGSHTFRARAFDNVGNYSEEDAAFTLTVRNINEFKNVIFERDDIADKTIEHSSGFFYNANGYLVDMWNALFSDFGDMTFRDLGNATWGHGNTGESKAELISPVIDTYHVCLTSIRYVFDISLALSEPLWGDIWDLTFSDVQGQTFYTLTSNASCETYIRFSNDGETWTEWQLYIAATYEFRYIQYKIIIDGVNTNSSITIKRLKQYYDVPDWKWSARDSTSNGYKLLDFGRTLYTVPDQISFIVTDVNKQVSPVIIPSLTGIEVYTYDYQGNPVDCNFMVTVNGY